MPLLDPRKPFNNWIALLDSRIRIRKLDHLCEEQYDALQELRDHLSTPTTAIPNTIVAPRICYWCALTM